MKDNQYTIMKQKVNNALEQEKIAIAGQIFNGEEPDEEESEEFDGYR